MTYFANKTSLFLQKFFLYDIVSEIKRPGLINDKSVLPPSILILRNLNSFLNYRANYVDEAKLVERTAMNNLNVVIVGSNDKPIKLHWDFQENESDKSLLMLSICSGAYGKEYLDKDSFFEFCNNFFGSAQKEDKYYKQLQFVISCGVTSCIDYLNLRLQNEWDLFLEPFYEDVSPAKA